MSVIGQSIERVKSLFAPFNKATDSSADTFEGILGEVQEELALDMKDDELLTLKNGWQKAYEAYVSPIVPKQEKNLDHWLGKKDDPNAPNLLSLPYLGYCSIDDPIYIATRKFILSKANPFYVQGKVSGLTSPHAGTFNQFWPIATIMQAMTSEDENEIISCLRTLKQTHAGTFFIHESVNVDNPKKFTRPWFGWANSLFGELILNIVKNNPKILGQTF